MTQDKNAVQHLAIIMDGNRRWAAEHNVPVLYQKDSQRAVYEAITFCQEQGIAHLSLYALSLENLENRDEALLQRLFELLVTESEKNKEQWRRQNVRIRVAGKLAALPEDVQRALRQLEKETANATGLELTLLLAYGGQQEIVHACTQIANKAVAGELRPEAIDAAVVAQHLWTAPTPPPDLIIRTGGVSRLSNFLLYQAAYSELLFVEYYWPDMTKERLHECVEKYRSITRNFGA